MRHRNISSTFYFNLAVSFLCWVNLSSACGALSIAGLSLTSGVYLRHNLHQIQDVFMNEVKKSGNYTVFPSENIAQLFSNIDNESALAGYSKSTRLQSYSYSDFKKGYLVREKIVTLKK